MSDHVPTEPQDFAGLDGVALVTGGSGGLGSAVALLLARRGADVAITYRSNADRAAEVVAAIEATGRRGSAHRLMADDADGAAALVEEVSADGLHTLVHAAGPIVPQRHLSRIAPHELTPQMTEEIAGFFNVAQPALPHLRRAQGSIVAVTTAATRRFPVRDGLSAAGKGAVEQLCWGLAAEEGRFGIRVNCVGPGMTTAGMAQDLTASGDLAEADFAAATANIPLRRFGDAADIAEAVCFLASARAGYISGQHLAVDGGYGV
ncbi:MAG: SDR family oxidoreductase [Candidatus Microthrix sp.]|jgi:NAD(P)-dependent dehydrogenase (short-subunit alcohol dehydrogenase family)|nr:SDR family oxidoreductase [Candidatus Microthrix sp.]